MTRDKEDSPCSHSCNTIDLNIHVGQQPSKYKLNIGTSQTYCSRQLARILKCASPHWLQYICLNTNTNIDTRTHKLFPVSESYVSVVTLFPYLRSTKKSWTELYKHMHQRRTCTGLPALCEWFSSLQRQNRPRKHSKLSWYVRLTNEPPQSGLCARLNREELSEPFKI